MGLRAAQPLAALLLLLLASACGGDEPATNGQRPGRPARKGPVVYGRAPDFQFVDQRGQRFSTDAMVGRVWVANFFFSRCKSICPVQMARLLSTQSALEDHPQREDIHFVSVSVDGGHDQPAVLQAYAEKNGVDGDHWSLVTGSRRDAWLLSTGGFRIPSGEDPADANVPPGHSGLFVVIDRRGRIRNLIDSQATDSATKLTAALKELAAEPRPRRIVVPDHILDVTWLEEVAAKQRAAAKTWKVRHDFQFRDSRLASGISFKHRIVDDSAKRYKAVHYDHGNGVAVADVDGDGLYDIYFSNQVGSNQLWRNLGNGRFEDITDEAGVAVKDPVGVTASFADTDNDGDPDLYVTTVRGGNYFFVNDGKGVFEDRTQASGLSYSGHSSAGVFFDYNKDGLLDLLLCNVGVYTQDEKVAVIDDSTTAALESGPFEYYLGHLDGFSGHLKPKRNERLILYRNMGGNRFKDFSKKLMLDDVSWSGAATPIDANGDGWLDLYVLNMQGHDQYYENVLGGMFERKSSEVFPKTPWGSMGVKVFDYDADGDFDLYLTDMHSDMSNRVDPNDEKKKSTMLWAPQLTRADGNDIWGNAFFRREADGTYREVSDQIGAETYWPWGISVDDLNADGYDDVFVTTGMNYLFRYSTTPVLLNDGGRGFVDSEFVLGVEPRVGPLFKPWFDVACGDGEDGDHQACKGQDGPGVVWAPLASRSSVIFDLDDDGDLDIVTNDFNSPPRVLLSDLSTRGDVHAIKVRLRGRTSNRDGLGAIVRVHVGGKVFSKVHDGQSGYISQSSKPLYFGLGKHAEADKIEVTWPSGTKQTIVKPAPIRGLLLIEEPAR